MEETKENKVSVSMSRPSNLPKKHLLHEIKLKYLPNYKRLIALSAIMILIAVSFILYFLPYKNQMEQSGQVVNPLRDSWKSYGQLLSEGTVEPLNRILQVDLSYQTNTSELNIERLTVKNGYVPKMVDEDEYELLILSQVQEIYAQPFNIHKDVYSPPPLPGEDPEEESVHFDTIYTTVTVPWIENSDTLQVKDQDGNLVASSDFSALEYEDNSPSFRSRKGDNVDSSLQSYLLNFLKFNAKASTSNSLDITFIGDDYISDVDIDKFHSDVERLSAYLIATFDPFKTRSSQITFHYVDNKEDLGCQYYGRMILCDNTKVYDKVNSSGVPYDKIVVIINNSTYGGAAYPGGLAMTYNGEPYSGLVFVHELGHSLAKLKDEYVSNVIYADMDKNCYDGNPPNSLWEEFVSQEEYFLGCSSSGWYRSSQNSVMRALDAPYFNKVSQYWINYYIDQYAGKFEDSDPTDTPTPDPSATVTPTTSPNATSTPVATGSPTATAKPNNDSTISPTPADTSLNCAKSPSLALNYTYFAATPGQNLNNGFVITNNSDSGCDSETYTISASQPSGWNITASSTTVSVNPSETKTIPFTITVGTNAEPKTYFYQLWASNFGPATASVDVTASSPSPTPTPQSQYVTVVYPNGGETWKIGDQVTLQWNSNITNSCSLTIETVGDKQGGYYIFGNAIGVDESYNWTVDWPEPIDGVNFPQPPFDAKLQVNCSDHQYVDRSDNPFRLNP